MLLYPGSAEAHMGAFERPKSQPSSPASEPRISGGRGGTRYQHLLKLPSSFTSASSKCTIYPTSESPGTLPPDLEGQNHAWGSISKVLKSPIDSNAWSSLITTALVHVASVCPLEMDIPGHPCGPRPSPH